MKTLQFPYTIITCTYTIYHSSCINHRTVIVVYGGSIAHKEHFKYIENSPTFSAQVFLPA